MITKERTLERLTLIPCRLLGQVVEPPLRVVRNLTGAGRRRSGLRLATEVRPQLIAVLPARSSSLLPCAHDC